MMNVAIRHYAATREDAEALVAHVKEEYGSGGQRFGGGAPMTAMGLPDCSRLLGVVRIVRLNVAEKLPRLRCPRTCGPEGPPVSRDPCVQQVEQEASGTTL